MRYELTFLETGKCKIMAVIFVELNELNFPLIKNYIDSGKNLPNFNKLFDTYKIVRSIAEPIYENNEPWIQWVSVHTGLSFNEHGIFRLGDSTSGLGNTEQIFEYFENQGLRVGAISPMNAVNKLSDPAYFIPDPWTQTFCDSSAFSRRISMMLTQTVNDNSKSSISKRSLITLLEIVIRTCGYKGLSRLFESVKGVRSKKWFKALTLDLVIHHLHLWAFKKKRPDVSFIFLNGGAHIQHHYMLNSIGSELSNPDWYVPESCDPVLDMLQVYDKIIGDYLSLTLSGDKVVFATGLSQIPYEEETFYYRLKSHEDFLSLVGINFEKVNPRMTRDFEVLFASHEQKLKAKSVLSSCVVAQTGLKVFDEICDGASGISLFITLTYSREITQSCELLVGEHQRILFKDLVSFVAIKNGKHCNVGYVLAKPEHFPPSQQDTVDVHKVYEIYKFAGK